MVNILFYNLNHIGDVYLSSGFINTLVEQNSNINFYYYYILGDCFLLKKKNLKRINNCESVYSTDLQSGDPPEHLVCSDFLNILLENKFEKKQLIIQNFDNKQYLLLNTWAAAPVIKHNDFDLISAMDGWKRLIIETSKIIKHPLKFHITPHIDLTNMMTDYPVYELSEEEKNKMKDYIFIFNYKPRSVDFDMNRFENYIDFQVKNNKVMLANYSKKFDNNENILFFEKYFNIKPTPDCLNLKKIWDIICYCKKIIILPCGSGWTFFHKLKQLRSNQIYIWQGNEYTEKLNNNIKFINNKNNVNINNAHLYINE